MRKMTIIAVCLVFCAMTLAPYAWAEQDPPSTSITVTAEVLADINNQVGLGFTTGWDGNSLDPTTQTGWSATSTIDTPWIMGFIVPDAGAHTLNSPKTTSLACYHWVYQYQSNTWSGVDTTIGNVTGKESFYTTLKDYVEFYKWAGNKLSETPMTSPPQTQRSVPIHPSYTQVWNFPTKLSLDIEDIWSITAGEYWAKVTNQWFYSDVGGTIGSNDDHNPIERYFKVTVDKALSGTVGLVFGKKWENGEIAESGPFTVDDAGWTDGVAYTFYGGLEDFQSNTTAYNKLTIGPAKQATGVDLVTDLRKYILQYFWTGSGFRDDGVSTYPEGGGDYVVESTLTKQSVSCTVPNKFQVAIPKEDVFKVGAGTYTAAVKSEWSFADHTGFTAIDGATKEKSVSITVPEYYGGYALPSETQSFSGPVKPEVAATYRLTVEGFQNHKRQVTVATTLGTGLNANDFSLEVSDDTQHVTGSVSDLNWTGTFDFNNGGNASQLPLIWTFTPDWSYLPGRYTMTVTLTHAPQA